MKVAIIPARAGSKRIPHKNFREFHGKSVINYSIQAAIESSLFDKIVISTDEVQVEHYIEDLSAVEINSKRPEILADDEATIRDVIQYEIQRLGLDRDDEVCLIYATAPFLKSSNLIESHMMIKNSKADYVLSVGVFSPPIERALSINEEGYVSINMARGINSRTQDLNECYFDAAQFCWGTVSTFLSDKLVLNANTFPYVLNRDQVVDIDTMDDWNFATKLYSAREDIK